MKNEKMFRAIGQISDDKIAETDAVSLGQKPKKPLWIKWASVAAAACALLVVIGLTVPGSPAGDDMGQEADDPISVATENPSAADDDPDVTPVPAHPEEVATEEEPQDNALAIGGGGDPFERKFFYETYGIGITYEIVGHEVVDEWVENVFLQKTREEMNATPDLYQAVTELGIDKESLIEANNRKAGKETYIDDYIIEALYQDVPTMIELLKNPLAFEYDGRLYVLYDLCSVDIEFLKSIPPDILEEYLTRIEAWCEESHEYRVGTIEMIRERVR
jgi:hypothetical protein